MDSFADRTKRRLRDELLDAAYDAIVAGGYDGLRMDEVARRTGVSRQTVYNEFGDKWGVLQAVAARETERFLLDVNAALAEHSDPIDGLRAAVERALTLAGENPLVKAALEPAGIGPGQSTADHTGAAGAGGGPPTAGCARQGALAGGTAGGRDQLRRRRLARRPQPHRHARPSPGGGGRAAGSRPQPVSVQGQEAA